FDITVASEVMAIFCLASDLEDLKKRLSNIIIGYTRDRKPVRAGELKAHGAMAALLKEALAPNLVQTLEGTPAFVHGGPLANLARHVENVQKFGIVPVVSINRFSADTDAEIALVKEACKKLGVEAIMADHWAEGGKGAADVARAVVKVADAGKSKLKLLYPDDMPLIEKIRTIAREIYRAKDIDVPKP